MFPRASMETATALWRSSSLGAGHHTVLLTPSLRHDPPKRGYAIVQRAFPRVYALLAANLGNPFETTPWSTWSWDKAQWWRHWLLDTWVDRSWPEAAFLHCLEGDTALFMHIARYAWSEGQRARMFILRTPYALRDDPSLAARWSQLLSRIDGDWDPRN